ncbi:serine/threonine protein kinase [Lasiodiplodia theobromae]|nr:serine/threonine protein kinase [Lasiodiplodia theobromae]
MPQNSSERLAAYFPAAPIGSLAPPRRYTDTDIEEIAALLEDHEKQWSSVPRTYIVLRTIGHLDLLNKLIQLGFTDHCFPVKASVLPPRLQPSVRNAIVQAQSIIITKSLDLEKGEYGKHWHFAKGEPQPFKVIGLLGAGGYSHVHRIRSTISFKEYALKRVRRRRAFGNNSKESVRQFTAEMKLLKSLSHRHMVEYVGSYTDPSNLGILMAPVADKNLAEYLETVSDQPENLRKNELVTLRSFFGCLASALQYLHDRSICHGDIKPENVLVDGGNVLFTDFGFSKENTGSTTSGITNTTPRYAPLEVLSGDPRNASADVWSLGCLFLEMVLVLKEKDVSFLKAYFLRNGSKEPYASRNPEAVEKLLRELRFLGNGFDNILLDLMTDMLREDRFSRPKAAEALAILSTPSFDDPAVRFCGLCCLGDEVSDSHDSLCEDLYMPGEKDPLPTFSLEENFREVSADTIQAASDNPRVLESFGGQPFENQQPESQSPEIRPPENEPSESQPSESPPLEINLFESESVGNQLSNSHSLESQPLSDESSDGDQMETSVERGGPIDDSTLQIPSDHQESHMEDESGPSVEDSTKPAEEMSMEQPRARYFHGSAEIPDSDQKSDVDRAEIKNRADNANSMLEIPGNLDRPTEEFQPAEMNVSSMRLLLEREALAVFGVATAVNLKQQSYKAVGQQGKFIQQEDFGKQDVDQQNNLNPPDSVGQQHQAERQDELEQQKEMYQQYKQDQQDGASQQGEVDQQEISNRNLYKFLPFNVSTGPPSITVSQDGSLPSDSPKTSPSFSIPRLFKSKNNESRKPKLSKRLTTLLRRPLSRNKNPESSQSSIFGASLEDTLKHAGVAVGIFDESDEAYVFGSVPLVVAQCGVFLKEKALDVKEIFTMNSDEMVNSDLCLEFNASPQYGKDIDWSKYTAQDAANMLIYYLEWLPEPVVPPQLYNRFTQLVRDEDFVASFAAGKALPNAEFWIKHYQQLIQELSLANARLLLYLLDVLAVFTSDSGINRMNFERLAKLFTGSLLKGLNHEFNDSKSYLVLVFLIVNSNRFLLSGFVESNWRYKGD